MKVLSINGQEFVVDVDEVVCFGLVRRRRFFFLCDWRLQIVLKNGKKLYVQNSYEDLVSRYERGKAYGIERRAYVMAGAVA